MIGPGLLSTRVILPKVTRKIEKEISFIGSVLKTNTWTYKAKD